MRHGIRYGNYCTECRKLNNPDCSNCELNQKWLLDETAEEAITLFSNIQNQFRTVGSTVTGIDYGGLFQVAKIYCIDITPAIWRYIRAMEEELLSDGK